MMRGWLEVEAVSSLAVLVAELVAMLWLILLVAVIAVMNELYHCRHVIDEMVVFCWINGGCCWVLSWLFPVGIVMSCSKARQCWIPVRK
ncbi:hypothetical protein U1Q18_011747, partial [Sarracenia purpurea var. burkii]